MTHTSGAPILLIQKIRIFLYSDRMNVIRLSAVLICLSCLGLPVQAGTWKAAGLVFSDELGGFRIDSVSGAGTLEDPVVIRQRVAGTEPTVLVVRLDPDGDQIGRAFTERNYLKISIVAEIVNESRRAWAGFDFELQEILGQPSVYRDGLSFDQVRSFGKRKFVSDRFNLFTDLTEPYDRVRFEQGHVDPGEMASFTYFVTDVTPINEFYVVQEPKLLTAQRDPDGALIRYAFHRGHP